MRNRLASRTKRLAGQLLDAIIGVIPAFAAPVFAVFYPWGVLLSIAAILACIAYYLFGDALPGGQSYGKRLLGIAVIDQRTRQPCRPSQSFFRNLFLLLLGPIDWLFIFRPSRQRLGDWFAGTIVVESNPSHPASLR